MVKDIFRYKKYVYKNAFGFNLLIMKLNLLLVFLTSLITYIKQPEEIGIFIVIFCFTLNIFAELEEIFLISFCVNKNFAKGIRNYLRKRELNGYKKLNDFPIYYTDDIDVQTIGKLKEVIYKLDNKYLSKFIENGNYFVLKKPKRFKSLRSFAAYNNITNSITINVGLKFYDFKDEENGQIYTGVKTMEDILTHEFAHYIFEYELNCISYTKRLYKIFKEEKKKFYTDTYKTNLRVLQIIRELKNKDKKISEMSYRYSDSPEFYAENYKDYKLGIEIPNKVKEIIEAI